MPRVVNPGDELEQPVASRLSQEDKKALKVACMMEGLNEANAVRMVIKKWITRMRNDNPAEFERLLERENQADKPKKPKTKK